MDKKRKNKRGTENGVWTMEKGERERDRLRAAGKEGVKDEYWWNQETDDEIQQKERQRIMESDTEKAEREETHGVWRRLVYSSSPLEDKDKDTKKVRQN